MKVRTISRLYLRGESSGASVILIVFLGVCVGLLEGTLWMIALFVSHFFDVFQFFWVFGDSQG